MNQSLHWATISLTALLLVGCTPSVSDPESKEDIGCTPSVSDLESKGDVDGLIKRLSIEKDRVEAINSLGRLRDFRAVTPLLNYRHCGADLQVATKRALGEIGNPYAVDAVSDLSPVFTAFDNENLLLLIEQRAIPQLKMGMKSDYPFLRYSGALQYAAGTDALIDIFLDKNENQAIRDNAIRRLRESKDPKVKEAFITYLKDNPVKDLPEGSKEYRIRHMVIYHMDFIGDERVEEAVIAEYIAFKSHCYKSTGIDFESTFTSALLRIGSQRGAEVSADFSTSSGELLTIETALFSAELTSLKNCGAAARGLAMLNWKPTCDVDKVHYWIARRDITSLKNNWSLTKKILLSEFCENQTREYALSALISINREDVVQDLIAIFENPPPGVSQVAMAKLFLYRGVPELHHLASTWADQQGYEIQFKIEQGENSWGDHWSR